MRKTIALTHLTQSKLSISLVSSDMDSDPDVAADVDAERAETAVELLWAGDHG